MYGLVTDCSCIGTVVWQWMAVITAILGW